MLLLHIHPTSKRPTFMAIKRRPRSARQQRHVRKDLQKVARQVDAMSSFNLLTGPELLGRLEALLPEYRERKYPPTVTLAIFLGQVLSPRIASPRLVLGVIVASPGMLPAALDCIAFLRRQTGFRFVECKRWKWGPKAEFGNISDEAFGNRIT